MRSRAMLLVGMFGSVLSMVVACGAPGSRHPPTSSSSTTAPAASNADQEERLVPGELSVTVSGNAVEIILTQGKECRTPRSEWAPCGMLGVAGEEVTLRFPARPLTVKTGFGGKAAIEFKDEDHLRKLLRRSRPPSLGAQDDEDADEQGMREALRDPRIEVVAKDATGALDLSKLAHFAGWKQEHAEREQEARDERRVLESQLSANLATCEQGNCVPLLAFVRDNPRRQNEALPTLRKRLPSWLDVMQRTLAKDCASPDRATLQRDCLSVGAGMTTALRDAIRFQALDDGTRRLAEIERAMRAGFQRLDAMPKPRATAGAGASLDNDPTSRDAQARHDADMRRTEDRHQADRKSDEEKRLREVEERDRRDSQCRKCQQDLDYEIQKCDGYKGNCRVAGSSETACAEPHARCVERAQAEARQCRASRCR